MKFGRFHVFILFLFVPSQEAFASVNKKITLTQPTVILISFDGFRWDYLDKVPTPNFDSIVRNGVKAKHIINTFVTKTFPNHYTIVTGLYEESHGILGNNMYDPVFNETFHIGSPSFLDIKWWNGEPVWVTNQKAFKKSAVVFWPGSEVKGQTPTHFLKYNNKLPFKKRVQYLLDQLEGNDPPSFLAAYFNEPDHTGHQVGPNSPELHKVIRRVDNVTGYLLKSLQNRGLLDQVRFRVHCTNELPCLPILRSAAVGLTNICFEKLLRIHHGTEIFGLNVRFKHQVDNSSDCFDFTDFFDKQDHITVVSSENLDSHLFHHVVIDY